MIFLLLFHQKQLILINYYNKQNLYIICYYLYLQIY